MAKGRERRRHKYCQAGRIEVDRAHSLFPPGKWAPAVVFVRAAGFSLLLFVSLKGKENANKPRTAPCRLAEADGPGFGRGRAATAARSGLVGFIHFSWFTYSIFIMMVVGGGWW